MKGGFTFCDVDIDDIGLIYAPENENTYVYREGKYDVHEESIEAHDGGYMYGMSLKPKEFVLRCYFEDKGIKNGIMDRIHYLFKRGKTGKLVFHERPWLWYNATVTEIDTSDLKSKYNGIVTIYMKAYYPFARTDLVSIDSSISDQIDLTRNSGFLYEADRIPPTEIAGYSDGVKVVSSETSFLLYNPGTEAAKTAISIAGNAPAGFKIVNNTNGEVCRISTASPALYGDGYWLTVDGMNGKVYLTNGISASMAFLYHDYGFIELEPAYPIIRQMTITYTKNSNTAQLRNYTPWNVTGQYVYLNGGWRKIINQPTELSITLKENMTKTSEETTDIVTMNELTVIPNDPSNFLLSKLSFDYKATFL